MNEDLKNLTVSLLDLAEILGIGIRHVQRLASEGVLQKADRGQYLLIPSIQGFMAVVEERVDGSSDGKQKIEEQKLRLATAQADKAEREIKEMEGNLLDRVQVMAAWGETAQMMKTRLLAIPSKLPELNASQKEAVQKQIHQALSGIANVDIRDFDAEDSGK